MAGTVLTIAAVMCAAALATGYAGVGAAAAWSQRLAGAADSAALAAADSASGAIAGDPCELAGALAAAGGADLVDCELDGLVARVTVSAAFLRIPVAASARAGPPPSSAGAPSP